MSETSIHAISCPLCNEFGESREVLTEHLHEHLKYFKYPCTCGQAFVTKSKRDRHCLGERHCHAFEKIYNRYNEMLLSQFMKDAELLAAYDVETIVMNRAKADIDFDTYMKSAPESSKCVKRQASVRSVSRSPERRRISESATHRTFVSNNSSSKMSPHHINDSSAKGAELGKKQQESFAKRMSHLVPDAFTVMNQPFAMPVARTKRARVFQSDPPHQTQRTTCTSEEGCSVSKLKSSSLLHPTIVPIINTSADRKSPVVDVPSRQKHHSSPKSAAPIITISSSDGSSSSSEDSDDSGEAAPPRRVQYATLRTANFANKNSSPSVQAAVVPSTPHLRTPIKHTSTKVVKNASFSDTTDSDYDTDVRHVGTFKQKQARAASLKKPKDEQFLNVQADIKDFNITVTPSDNANNIRAPDSRKRPFDSRSLSTPEHISDTEPVHSLLPSNNNGIAQYKNGGNGTALSSSKCTRRRKKPRPAFTKKPVPI